MAYENSWNNQKWFERGLSCQRQNHVRDYCSTLTTHMHTKGKQKEEKFMALFNLLTQTLPSRPNFYGTKFCCLWILISYWPLQPRVWLITLHEQRICKYLIRKLTPVKMLRDGCIGKEMLNGEAASPGGDVMLLVSLSHCFILELDIMFVF